MSGIVASPTIREVFREIESAVTEDTLDSSTVKLGAQFAAKLAVERADQAVQQMAEQAAQPDAAKPNTDGAPVPVSTSGIDDQSIPWGGGVAPDMDALTVNFDAVLAGIDAPATQQFDGHFRRQRAGALL